MCRGRHHDRCLQGISKKSSPPWISGKQISATSLLCNPEHVACSLGVRGWAGWMPTSLSARHCPCEELASRLLLTPPPCPASIVSFQSGCETQAPPRGRAPRWARLRSHDKGKLVESCKGLTWKDKLLSMMNEVGSFKQKRR